ncbi:MAG: T9SS type A sorting domain-containing protein, partial [Bacteroidota bacterium]|nr:T9SS type A sorting domain-containing protein [Bacteroidota bacterium]
NAGPDVNICKGKSATLNATGGAKYAWLPAYGLSKADTSSPVANPTFTITYIVTVTDANNCKNKDTIIVKVNDNPIVDAGKDIVMCPNSQVNLIAKTQNAKGNVKYLWTPNTDLNADNIYNPITRPANSISYTVMITDGNNCTATDNIFVRVQPKTTVELGMDTAICKGDTMRFNCPKYIGATYQWSPVIRLTNPKIPNPGASPLVKTRYYLTVTDSVGCKFTDSIMVNVKDVPKVDVGADQTICKGSKTTFAALGEFSCHWAPTTCLSSTSIFNPVASPATTTTYYLTVTDDHNCTATDKIVVNVISVEKPVIKASKGTGFCDSSLVFTNLDAGIGYKTYLWSTGSSTQNINVSSAGDYWVKVSGQGSCQVTSDTLKIIVFPKSPKPEIMINGKSEFCAGERVNLYVKNSFKAYHWSSGSTTDSIKVFQAGKYVVTVTDINNCVLVSAPKVIKVDLKPIAMFDYILKDSLRVDFVNRSVNGLNYAWTFGTEGKDSVSDPVFYFKNEGNRMITLKTDNACGTSIDSMTIWVYKRIPFGIDEVSSVNSFNVYPNPATDFINISYSKERIENSYIMIIDPIGQVILRERLTDNLSQFNKSYNVKGLAEGIYMIRLINDSLTKSVRVIVTK